MIRDKILFLFGLSAFLLPESATLSILLVFATAATAIPKAKYPVIIISILVGLAALFLIIPAPLATAIIAAVALFFKGRKVEGVGVLLLQTSLVSSLEAILSDTLFKFHIEAAGPAILAGLILIFIQPKSITKKFLILFVIPLVSYSLIPLVSNPSWLMIFSALPVLFIAYQSELKESLKSSVTILGIVVMAVAISWIYSLPREFNKAYVLLPNATESPEFKYYENYAAASKFTGLDLIEVKNTQDIPANSLLVLPWLTESIDGDHYAKLKSMANKRKWTVILVGEHTNMGGVLERVNALTGSDSLRDDLTSPPESRDNSGPLRTSSLITWPQTALLNRGASVAIHSPFDKVLLSGDGWWSEKNIGEWLWVGDYVWQSNDRNGRLGLIANIVDKGAHWIVVGDSSPFLNKAMLADPRPLKSIIKMASLWPTFFRDLLLVLLIIIGGFYKRQNDLRYLIFLVLLPIIAIAIAPKSKSSWDYFWIGETAFTESNFNNQLSKSKLLLETQWKLIRSADKLNESMLPKNNNAAIFGLVNEGAKIDGITFTNCHRIGNIQTTEGPSLMNAQVCRITGEAEAIIGNNEEAAAIKFTRNGIKRILILDQNFLSQSSKNENVDWLLSNLKTDN